MSGKYTVASADGLPLLGNLPEFVRDPTDAMEAWASEGDIVELDIASRSPYFVTDPGVIEDILISNSQKVTIGPEQQQLFDGVAAKSVSVSTGDDWQRRRQVMMGPFTGKKATSYREDMIAEAVKHVEGWTDGQRFQLRREMRELTVPMLTKALHGLDVEGGPSTLIAATDAVEERARFSRPGRYAPDWVPTLADIRFDRRAAELEAYIDEVIQRQRESDIDGTVCATLLEASDNGFLSEEEVRENLIGIMFGGNTSPSGVMMNAWRMLTEHPSLHDRLLEEYEQVVDGEFSPADVDDLELTEATISETLRMYPPFLAINRRATEPFSVDGFQFEPGDEIWLSQWVVHRDEEYWDDPEQFDPDRWLEEADRPKFAHFPFGGGPRVCPGRLIAMQQMTIALAVTVGRADLQMDPKVPLDFKTAMNLKAKETIEATVSLR